MKNMRIAKKLIVGFLLVAMLAAAVGAVGIMGMLRISASGTDIYELQTVPMPMLAKAIEMLQRQRACIREFIVGAATNDLALIEDAYRRIKEYDPILLEAMDTYEATIRDPEALRLFTEARALYENDFKECEDLLYEQSKAGADPAALYELMGQYTAATNKIVDDFDICMSMKIDVAAAESQASDEMARTLLIAIIAVLAVALIAAIILAIYISGLVSKPLFAMSKAFSLIGDEGIIEMPPDIAKSAQECALLKDEIGTAARAFGKLIGRLTNISHTLEKLSEGDLTQEIALLSDGDTMGISLKRMIDNLNKMFTDIQISSKQVSGGAVQISDGAQLLAQGATEQSATVEELSASITEISDQTKSNSGTANEARDLGEDIKQSAEQGNQQMEQMMRAVQEINESSKSISKVIKIIDDIAFQTNILALNAAVEAARAGQHGKGFAVVADEVRSLAAKSAEAAKNTNELIETSIQKAEQGAAISQETSESLKKIVEGILRSSELIAEIAKSSEEQSIAITQVSDGIDQVSQVVQQNSATAEESAAASEEMSGQATLLQELIAQFRLKDQGSMQSFARTAPAKAAAPAPAAAAPIEPADHATGYAISDGSKY